MVRWSTRASGAGGWRAVRQRAGEAHRAPPTLHSWCECWKARTCLYLLVGRVVWLHMLRPSLLYRLLLDPSLALFLYHHGHLSTYAC